jgi:predicted ribosome quality control (RQC) complex YloA/Tae2 family protein
LEDRAVSLFGGILTLKLHEIQSVVQELRPLIGGRIQRLDLIKPDQIVFEIRCPQRTFRLLVSAEPGLGRIHLIDRRPKKPSTPPPQQGAFRKWLVGKPIFNLHANEGEFYVDCPNTRFAAQIRGGTEVFRVLSHQSELLEWNPEKPKDFPFSDSIAAKYEEKSAAANENDVRCAVLRDQRNVIKKNKRLLKNLKSDEFRLKKMELCRVQGELLKPHLNKIQRGQSSLDIFDWHGQPVTITLDPALGPKSNLEALFKRAKKADRGLPRVSKRLATVQARLIEQNDRLEWLATLSLQELLELDANTEYVPPGAGRAKKGSDTTRPKLREFKTIDGFQVRVGKGAKENDYLTLRVARGHDLWLHARGSPGAHVVLHLEKNTEPTSEALLDASHLAAFYSDRRAETQVEVLYTRAKYVRKSKGAAPGSVGVSKEKTINLRIENDRLDRLLGRELPE